MSNFVLKLEKYIYLEDKTESLIIFKIYNSHKFIKLKKIFYECNPLLDVELLNLHNFKLIDAIYKIQKIISKDEYKNKFIKPLTEFRNELIKDFFPDVIQPNPTIRIEDN